MPENPLLSICILTFNRDKLLTGCLDSFTRQVDEGIAGSVEIIINDNASTDGTGQVATAFSNRHAYIRYFRNETNIGAEANLFRAVGRARGKWAWVFGDDDLLLDGGLKKVLFHITRDNFDFIMTNKTVKNRDLTETFIEKQTPTRSDITFSDIKDLCAEFGFFTNLGFISTSIFRREPFVAIDPAPILALKMQFPQNGVWLQAFNHRPCLYVADALVCQRLFTNEDLPRVWLYVSTLGVIRLFRILASKGIIDYPFAERIKESLLGGEGPFGGTMVDVILGTMRRITRGGYFVTVDDWMEIIEFFLHLKAAEPKREALQIYSEYISRAALAQITGEVRQPSIYESRDGANSGHGPGITGQWFINDSRVIRLKRLWQYHAIFLKCFPPSVLTRLSRAYWRVFPPEKAEHADS